MLGAGHGGDEGEAGEGLLLERGKRLLPPRGPHRPGEAYSCVTMKNFEQCTVLIFRLGYVFSLIL